MDKEDLKESGEEALDELEESGEEIQHRLGEIWDSSKEKATEYAHKTDIAIRDHPYQALGIAFGIGLLFGMILNRDRGTRYHYDD